MNLRLSYPENSQSRKGKAITQLHQCKQCGVLFEREENTTCSNAGEISWYSKFMIDKCDVCRNFRMDKVYN
jgi:hypothetical protein